MHYTGTIWRPPYEASSLLLEVTAGCTHHQCKFCTLYDDLPFKFRMTPMEDIEADLKEAKGQFRIWIGHKISRTFLTGANPFVLKASRLIEISDLIRRYFPTLKNAGYDGLTIGIETGDDEALTFMHKGYTSNDIVLQCQRLDRAGISYNFFYLTGVSGAGKGEIGARKTAEVCNQLHPQIIGANMLTIYQNSELYEEIQKGNWKEEQEIEKYRELKTLVEHLNIPVWFAAGGASNAIPIQGTLPRDTKKVISVLERIISGVDENELRDYRKNLRHL